MGFSRQEYWSGLPFPSPGDLLEQGIEPSSLALQAESLPFESPGKPRLIKTISFTFVPITANWSIVGSVQDGEGVQ